MNLSFVLYFSLAAMSALLLTPPLRRLAWLTGVLDVPKSERKIHKIPVPLLGGLAVFAAFALVLGAYLLWGNPDFSIIPQKFFAAIFFGGLILMAGGALDDKYNLPPKVLWIFPATASLVVVLSGIGVGIKQLSNPFGSPLDIGGSLDLPFFQIQLSAVLVWLWLMGMIFTTKFLDGLDGLCTGIGLIGALTLFALSLTEKVNQPMTASLAIIFAGALAGYLVYAFQPASIFLGEAGSTFIGFMLAVLSVILGGKIATALLVMGIPILDVAWVIVRRLWYRTSPFKADRQHLHFRLLDIGFSHRQTVLILYAISASFGFTAVFLQSLGKLIALVILVFFMFGLAITVVMLYKRQHPHIPDLFDYAERSDKPKAKA